MLTEKQLMAPRWKVIGEFPGNEAYPINEICTVNLAASDFRSNRIGFYNKYPNLFQPLKWWQERNIEDLPPYIRYNDLSYYFPTERVCESKDCPFGDYGFIADGFVPATEDEYNAYKLKNQKND